MNTAKTDSKQAAKNRIRFLLFCACGFVVAFSLAIYFLNHNSDVNGKRSELRLIADAERTAWEEENSKQAGEENEELKTKGIPELSKLAVDILVKSSNPDYIISAAIASCEETLGKSITRPPWRKFTKPENNKYWEIIYRKTVDEENDWWIERNTVPVVGRQYRLVGKSNQRVYFSIKKEFKLRSVLTNIIVFGKQGGSSMPFIQVVIDENVVVNDDCKKLVLEKARKIFPETVNLSANIYTVHPCNKYALIPVENFFANLALDKDNECIVLLGKMGAKSVHISRYSSEAASGSASGRFEGITHKVGVGISVAKELSSQVDFVVEFVGNSRITPPADLLQNSIWHRNDPQLSALLESQSGNNPVEKYIVSEKGMSYFNFDFKTAARILGIGEAAIQAEFQKEKERKRTFEVSF